MNRLYKITFGTEFNSEQDLISLNNSMKIALNQLENDIADHFGGYTVTKHLGGYKHESGEYVRENSASYEIVAKDSDRKLIVAIAEDLKEIFNQESVLLTETEINAVFV